MENENSQKFKTLWLKPELVDELETFLKAGVRVESCGTNEIIFQESVQFPDGTVMDIKVVNSDSGPWTEGVLFNKPAHRGDALGQIGCTDVWDELLGEYYVSDYGVVVKRSESNRGYNDNFSADDQIDTEERIAFLLFNDFGVDEEKAADAGREILVLVLGKFREDLLG